jgi:hypothetical protein
MRPAAEPGYVEEVLGRADELELPPPATPPKANTDRELWRASAAEPGAEAYADSVSVSADGKIVLCRGGFCIRGTVAEWHAWFAAAPEHQPVKE